MSKDKDFGKQEISRRTWLGGAALAVGGAACLVSAGAQAQSKMKQADAKYQDKPSGDSKCGNCAQFQPPKACKLVEGDISENGWCQLYTPKG